MHELIPAAAAARAAAASAHGGERRTDRRRRNRPQLLSFRNSTCSSNTPSSTSLQLPSYAAASATPSWQNGASCWVRCDSNLRPLFEARLEVCIAPQRLAPAEPALLSPSVSRDTSSRAFEKVENAAVGGWDLLGSRTACTAMPSNLSKFCGCLLGQGGRHCALGQATLVKARTANASAVAAGSCRRCGTS